MNFFINQAMGIGNSGVEHAEFYRAKRFDQAGLPYRYIFLALVRELHQAMAKWDLRNDQVIDMWEYFVLGGDYLTTGLTKTMKESDDFLIDGTDTQRKRESVTDSGVRIIETMVKYKDKHNPDDDILQVSSSRTELFNEWTGERKVMYETIDDPNLRFQVVNIHLFNEGGKHLFFRTIDELNYYFMNLLDQTFGQPSNFLIDRGEHVDEMLRNHPIPHQNIIYIVHADHLADRDDPKKPLWNDHYEYMFDHLHSFQRVVVATKLQREDILVDFPSEEDKKRVVAIPVGGVDDGVEKLPERQLGEPIKFITASRLAGEKHIDIAVKAVARLHDAGRNVIFDIYGQGEEHDPLVKLIEELGAKDYIFMRGLSDHLADIYPKSDIFVSTSFSEGFGLTYIEALNAALPIVTFKARFGAEELVHDGVNGYLAKFKREDTDDEKKANDDYNVTQIEAAMLKIIDGDYNQLRENTQASIVDFQDHVIADEWRTLIDEL